MYHGVRVADPYRWLEDPDAPETRQWVAAENALSASYLSAIPARAAIRDRLASLYRYARYAAPFRAGDKIFWLQNSGAEEQPMLYVKEPGLVPRVLLDPNTLAADGTVALATTAASPDGHYVAYATTTSGSDWQEIRVRDVKTARDLGDDLRWIKFSGIAWTRDARGFFYEGYDSAAARGPSSAALTRVVRNQRIFYHRVGRPQQDDQLIYERPDHSDWLFDTRVSDDGHYAVITISAGTDERTRIYFIDLDNPGRPRITAPIVKLFDNFDASYHFVSSIGQTFYIRTDRGAPHGQLVAVDINEPHEAQWQAVVREAGSMDVMLDARQVGSRFVVHFLHDAHSQLRLFALDGGDRGEVTLPAIGTVSQLSTRAEDTDLFFTFTSFLTPPAVYNYDTDSRVNLLYRLPALDADLSDYETRQVFYTSKDGTPVPMFITAKKGAALVLDGNNPTLLTGYGGFAIPETPEFSPAVIAWLEMGGVYAVANLRGGGEYGKAWHEAGMLGHKQNVFDDFVSAAQWLIAQKYTSPRKLAIAGASNGGLLVGAALTQHPELFGAALPAVGVMDMLRYQKFTIGWAWAPEYGVSDDPRQFRYLLAYSPLHNIHTGTRYPATLITTADHDDRVVPAHSYKFAAALQAAQGGDAPILLSVETSAGHGGGKPISKQVDESADWLAFLVKTLGVQR